MNKPIPNEVAVEEPLVQFDEEMLADWFKIPAKQLVEISLPRGAFDAIYVAVANIYQSLAHVQRAAMAKHSGHDETAQEETEEGARVARSGFNHLRNYQTIVMMLATGRAKMEPVDAEFNEEVRDGE